MTHLVENPKLIDAVLNRLQIVLGGINWLDNVYGKCYTYTDVKHKNRKLPVAYGRDGDYVHLVPNEMKGNTAFFVVQPESKYIPRKGYPGKISSQVSLLLWLDVSDANSSYNTEDVKAEVLEAIRRYTYTHEEVEITGVVEGLRGVFKEFDINFSDQPDMYPFYALRINMNLQYSELC